MNTIDMAQTHNGNKGKAIGSTVKQIDFPKD
jgi:hypothetical protein